MKTIDLTPELPQENPQLQKGDTFVRISKYGHVFGTVDKITHINIHSITYGCLYMKGKVTSTTGVEYDLEECFKVKKIYTPEQIEKLKELTSKLKDSKVSLENLRHNLIINKKINEL